MIYTIFAVLCNSLKGFCSKTVSGDIKTLWNNVFANLLRSGLAALIGLFIVILSSGTNVLKMSSPEFVVCFISGVAMAFFLMSWIFALRSDAYMLVSASSSASFVVPIIFGVFLIGEKFTVFKTISLFLICVAIFFLVRYNANIKGKIKKSQFVMLGVILVSQGINQSMQKLYTYYFPDQDVAVFSFYTFFIAFAALLVYSLFVKKDNPAEKNALPKRVYILTSIMAAAQFAGTYFQSLASKEIDAIVLYPIICALSLVSGSLMATFIFKEKMKRDAVIGIFLTLFALIFSRF